MVVYTNKWCAMHGKFAVTSSLAASISKQSINLFNKQEGKVQIDFKILE